MKRLAIIVIFVLAVVVFGTQVKAQTIDLISQTYHIYGYSTIPAFPFSFGGGGSMPPYLGPPLSGGAFSNGGASGSSLFVDISTGNGGGLLAGSVDHSASADLVFRPSGASYLDLSYTLESDGIAWASLTLSDLTTGVTLVSDSKAAGLSTVGSAEVPVVPSHTYELSANSFGYNGDPAGATATITAVPEPSAMLLVATGLLGLWGFRRKFKK